MVFLFSLSTVVIQYVFFRRGINSVRITSPVKNTEAGSEIQIGYKLPRGIMLLPGCIVDAATFFMWKDRRITAFAEYVAGSRQGIISLKASGHGRYNCSGISFMITDAAGFFRLSHRVSEPVELTVFPLPRRDFDAPETMNTGGEDISRVVRKQRNDDLIESRQYFPGDDVRRINWKAFAHSGELFIRLGEERPVPEAHLMIIADLSGAAESGLNPEQKNRYLDVFASSLSGLMRNLNDSGINIDILIPPGPVRKAADSRFLAELWWNDEPLSSSVLSRRKDSRCLLLTSPFSTGAESLCRLAASGGLSVNVVIPVIKRPVRENRTSLISGILFTDNDPPGERIPAEAEDASLLAAGLKNLKGVGLVVII